MRKGKLSVAIFSIIVLISACQNFKWENAPKTNSNATPAEPTLPPPVNLRALTGNSKLTIYWQVTAGATSYNLYFSNSPAVSKSTGTLIASVTSPFVHTVLTNSTAYYYVVTSLSSSGESVESAQTSATPKASRYIFATSGLYTGNLLTGGYPDAAGAVDGVDAANKLCQARAVAAGLTLTGQVYRAYVSTSITDGGCNIMGLSGKIAANCGLPYTVPTYDNSTPIWNGGNLLVHTSLAGLLSSGFCSGTQLCNPIARNELNIVITGFVRVNTLSGVADTQTAGQTYCGDLANAADPTPSYYGDPGAITSNWWFSAGAAPNNCATPMRLYCIEQ